MSSVEFELEGRRFEVKRLEPDDTCMGLEVLGKALGPAALIAFGTASEGGETEGKDLDYAALLQALLANASQISVLVKLFAPKSKFDRSNNGAMVELKPFIGEVFGGRVDLMIAFLVHAVRAEYASFLGGGGALGPLLAQLGASFSKSPKAPTG